MSSTGPPCLCNDYWKLNTVSTFNSYPLPRGKELIERLKEARFISTLDLTKSYWQATGGIWSSPSDSMGPQQLSSG